MDIIVFLVWLFLLAASIHPTLGRWLLAWVARVQMESENILDEWTQNLAIA